MKMKIARRLTAAIACLAMVGAMSACGSDSTADTADAASTPVGSASSAAPSSDAPADEPADEPAEESAGTEGAAPIKLTIAYSRAAEQVALWAAYEQGLFADNGLDVTLEEVADASSVAVAITGGSAQMGFGTAPEFLNAVSKGVELAVVCGLSFDTPENPRVKVFATGESGITDIDGLAGKKIAVAGLGGSAHVSTANLLKKAGVDVSTVQWVSMRFQEMSDALKVGRVDAAVSVYPFIGQLDKAGYTEVIKQYATEGSQIITMLTSSTSWSAANPEAVHATRAAIDQANKFVEGHEAEAQKIIEKYSGLSPEIVENMPLPNLEMEITADQLEFFQDMLVDQGFIKTPMDVSKLIAS